MAVYSFRDAMIMTRKKVIPVCDAAGRTVGHVQAESVKGFERGNVLSFTANDRTPVFTGIKKRGLKNFLAPVYEVWQGEERDILQDQIGTNFIYFSVKGKNEEQPLTIEENWSRQIEVKQGKSLLAVISPSTFGMKTTIDFEHVLKEDSKLFGMIILFYFMYKIYKDETALVQELLFD